MVPGPTGGRWSRLRFWNVRSSARGKPSITVNAVETMVVVTATSTKGRVHSPSVPV